MHPRYDDDRINQLWGDEALLASWQLVELAVMQARVQRREMPQEALDAITTALSCEAPDIPWWKDKESELRHDLNAFLYERRRYIAVEHQKWWHKGMTSYDTEESAFVRKLLDSVKPVDELLDKMEAALTALGNKYRFAAMMGVTHGQWADPISFGKRVASWLADLRTARRALNFAKSELCFSKLSGFVGNYTDISPELERDALKLLGFKPYVGATQILPRVMFKPLASAISGIASVLNKIATDIRLGARSSSVIYHEPFGAKQTGSSAGPGKRNTIFTEQQEGMFALVSGYENVLHLIEVTWEERAIGQSSAERIAWRDLFHAILRMLTVMLRMVTGLKVYPKNMLAELVRTNGCYAASVAKERLKELAAPFYIDAEQCYRMVQLGAFNLGYPLVDESLAMTIDKADELLESMQTNPLEPCARGNIRDLIIEGRLEVCDDLAPDKQQVAKWNRILETIFTDEKNVAYWSECFTLKYLLRNEHYIFEQIFDAT